MYQAVVGLMTRIYMPTYTILGSLFCRSDTWRDFFHCDIEVNVRYRVNDSSCATIISLLRGQKHKLTSSQTDMVFLISLWSLRDNTTLRCEMYFSTHAPFNIYSKCFSTIMNGSKCRGLVKSLQTHVGW